MSEVGIKCRKSLSSLKMILGGLCRTIYQSLEFGVLYVWYVEVIALGGL